LEPFALLFAMLFPSLATWLYFVVLIDHKEQMQIAYGVCKIIQFGFPLLWVWLVRRESIRLKPANGLGIGIGLLFGLVVLGAMLLGYYGYARRSPYLSEAGAPLWNKLQGMGVSTPLEFLLLAAFYTVVHSLLEEYYWRWFVFGRLRRWVPLVWAIPVSAAAFAAHHVIVVGSFLKAEHFWTATVALSLCVAAGGAVWAWIYHKSGSLLGPWLSHLLVDAGLMWIGYDLCRRYFA
jgi:membrane protease YdiL (CAAX protease family)